MEEYRQWLEQQIERCLNDKDLQREHWAFCKAYEKFTALRKPDVIKSVCPVCKCIAGSTCAHSWHYDNKNNWNTGQYVLQFINKQNK